jgi:hypothetical protein
MATVVVSPEPVSYLTSFFIYEHFTKHRRGPWWPCASRWRRYANWILLWLVVQPKYRSSNKKLPVRI